MTPERAQGEEPTRTETEEGPKLKPTMVMMSPPGRKQSERDRERKGERERERERERN